MTLLEDICQVHDGVLKAPPLRAYGHSETHCTQQRYVSELKEKHINDESVYKAAKKLAIESVRIMQLASKNIEKERQEAENRKAPTARTLYDIVNHDERESCTTCADSKRCGRHESITWCINWNELIQKPAYNHPIAVLRIEHDKPVFLYVTREMSGLDNAEDVKKAKAALNRLEQQDEPDYVFEVGILLGTVRK